MHTCLHNSVCIVKCVIDGQAMTTCEDQAIRFISGSGAEVLVLSKADLSY